MTSGNVVASSKHLRDEQRLDGGRPPVFGVGEAVEEGALVGDVLVDDPRRLWLVHEDVAAGYLAHHAQVLPEARQVSPLRAARRGASPRERGGNLF
jgi:hypothetical protein